MKKLPLILLSSLILTACKFDPIKDAQNAIIIDSKEIYGSEITMQDQLDFIPCSKSSKKWEITAEKAEKNLEIYDLTYTCEVPAKKANAMLGDITEVAKGEMSNAMLQEADGLGALFLAALASEVVAGSLSNIKLPELTQMTYKVTFTATYDKSVKKGNNFLIEINDEKLFIKTKNNESLPFDITPDMVRYVASE